MSYSHISDHLSMVFDGRRNEAYRRALEAVVGPETVVMDLGAGLGVHGLGAAKLGAAKVLLVDPAPVLEIARAIAADNDLGSACFFPTTVEELELDEKVDVIVSVFTGNFLLSEDLLPSLFYARDRFLSPGGHLIPDRARMEVVPVMAISYYEKHIDIWGMPSADVPAVGEFAPDYSAARSYAANTMYYDTRENFGVTPLGVPAALLEMDFTCATSADCNHSATVKLQQGGILHGWLGWFQMRLLDEWLSTSGEGEETHWRPVFLPLERPVQVAEGEEVGFALKRPEFGEWTWTTQYAGQTQRQSTFLSRPFTPEAVLRESDDYRPSPGERGAAASWLLQRMDGSESISALTADLRSRYPQVFRSDASALRFVRTLVDYCS